MKVTSLSELDETYLLAELSEIQVFSYLSDDEKREILKFSEIRQYDKGEKIIALGEESPELFAVFSGKVDVYKNHEGKMMYVSSIGRGDLFGEAAIFINMKRTADIIAENPVQLLAIERKNFLTFLKKNSDSGINMLMIMVYGLLRKLKSANMDVVGQSPYIKQDEINNLLGK